MSIERLFDVPFVSAMAPSSWTPDFATATSVPTACATSELRTRSWAAALRHPHVEGPGLVFLYTASPRDLWFYRTRAGAEIDLLLLLPDQRLWAVEVKR